MKTLLEQLIAEKKLLSNPARWIKGTFARDKNGNKVESTDDNAVCWCQTGAEKKIGDRINISSQLDSHWLKNKVSTMYESHNVDYITDDESVKFNDHDTTTHSDLMEFYDICIIHAKNCE